MLCSTPNSLCHPRLFVTKLKFFRRFLEVNYEKMDTESLALYISEVKNN